MRTDSTPRLLAIYHDGSFLPPLPLHGPTLICIFMKPNTIPPPPAAPHCLLASGKFEFEFKFEFLFILLRQRETGGVKERRPCNCYCLMRPRGQLQSGVDWSGARAVPGPGSNDVIRRGLPN